MLGKRKLWKIEAYKSFSTEIEITPKSVGMFQFMCEFNQQATIWSMHLNAK